MAITAEQVKNLREKTGAGMMECKAALTEANGNLEDATTRRHTTNPVPLMVWGDGSRETAASVTRLDQVTPAIVARHVR